VTIGTVSSHDHHGPLVGQYPNILVNDPAEDGTSPQDTHSETSLVLAGTTVIVGFNDSNRFNGGTLLHVTGFSRSTDRGATFADLGTLPENNDLGDPALARDDVTGRIYFATLDVNNLATIRLFRSDDNLATFVGPAINAAPGRARLDKEWLAVDNFAGSGQGNVYHIARDFGNGAGIFLFRSTNHGDSFGPNGGVLIASAGNFNVQGAWVAVGPDHAVYAAWVDQSLGVKQPQFIKMRKSTDQGQSFGPTITVAALETRETDGDLGLVGIRPGTTEPANFRSSAFPQLVVNPVSGDLYLTFNDVATGGKPNVFFTQSTDGGDNWSTPVRVNDNTTATDSFQPVIAVTPNGNNVGMFWYDRRLDSANNLIDRFGAIGVVSGHTVSFGPNFRISDESFPPEFGRDPVVAETYMGDYDQAVADNGSFYVTWGDNRLPSRGHVGNRADVRFARIPFAGPSVSSLDPGGNVFAPVDHFRVTFDEPILIDTATPDQFAVTDPSGTPAHVLGVSVVPGSNDQQFDVTLDTQTVAGSYAVDIGPHILDTAGHAMDQDGDGEPTGQDDDAFHGEFTIVGPNVLSTTLTGVILDSVDRGQVVFNTPIDPNSFTFDQFNLTGPDGPVNVTSITPVDDTNLAFDVTFDNQTTLGSYTLTIGPSITDAFGNAMAAPFVSNFMLSSERITNGCFDTGNFMGWTLSGNTQSVRVDTSPVHDPCHHAASLGPRDSEGFLAQRFPTVPGNSYVLDYFLQNDGSAPNRFHAMIDGVDLPGSVINNDPTPFAYREYTFTFVAAGEQTELKFGFRHDPAFFHLDGISVSPTSGAAARSRGNPAFESAAPVHAPAAAPRTPADLASVPALPQSPPVAARGPAHASEIVEALALVAVRKSQDAVDGLFASGLDDTSALLDTNGWILCLPYRAGRNSGP
jgi:hypothetical protein